MEIPYVGQDIWKDLLHISNLKICYRCLNGLKFGAVDISNHWIWQCILHVFYPWISADNSSFFGDKKLERNNEKFFWYLVIEKGVMTWNLLLICLRSDSLLKWHFLFFLNKFLQNSAKIPQPFKCQLRKMVKHTHTIRCNRRRIVSVCLTIWWGWRLKGSRYQ